MSNYNDLYAAAQYIISCMPSPYILWQSGYVSDGDGPPAWGVNEPPPPTSEVQRRGAFCAFVANAAHRHMGLTIPNPYNDARYDGGIVSYWEAYYSASEWFSLDVDYADGTFVMSPYNSEAAGDQGHIAMLWHYNGQLYAIEWIFSGATWDYTIEESNSWGNYSIAIRPEVWVPLAGGTWEGSTKPTPSTKGTEFTVDHLLSVYTENLSRADAKSYFPHMLAAFKEFDISTRDRIAAFLGHAVGEVGEFVYWEEIDHGAGRFGDYYGRGPLQLTWEEAYQQATDYYQLHHPEDKGVDFVANPDLVATPKYGFWTSAWYWRHGPNADLNPVADQGDFAAVIEAIYGGPHPSQEQLRWDYYNYAMKVLPADLTLEVEEKPVTPDPVKPPEDEKYPYGWFGINEQGYLKGVDVPKGTWAAFEKYEDGKLYLVGHSDPLWRKAKTKSHEVEYYEEDGEVVVKESDEQTYRYSKADFEERYEVKEDA